MLADSPILDIEFGLSQLSGNRQLLDKLLNKFTTEYRDLSDRLLAMLQQGNLEQARKAVHTVKGVAGNLGLRALHQQCKAFERGVSQAQDTQALLQDFTRCLQDTLNAIEGVEVTPQQASQDTAPSASGAGTQPLIDALERKEFIDPQRLNNLLTETSLCEKLKQQVLRAVNDLDYVQALNLLRTTRT